jgi:hypothetical protein
MSEGWWDEARWGSSDEQMNCDTALVCMSGHVVNWHMMTRRQDSVRFCATCEKETISKDLPALVWERFGVCQGKGEHDGQRNDRTRR